MKPEEQALIDAMNLRVRRDREREERARREKPQKPSWSPPLCSRPGCQRLADISEDDFTGTRPYFCGMECFRIVRAYTCTQGNTANVLPKLPPVGWTIPPEGRGRHRKSPLRQEGLQ
jgi:hypothetical protein